MKQIPHSWRKLPIQKRLKVPINNFNISEKEIKRIRKINGGKRKLIEAAKLQYELFKNIHTDLTVWIAGYASDSAVRQKLGSSKNLREMFIPQSITNKKINPSWQDTKRNIKVPEEMTEELAEETGIHIGDGNLNKCPDKKWGFGYSYNINGNLTDELIYHEEHIRKLMHRLYNHKGFTLKRENRNDICSVFRSKAILEYKNKILKLPIGLKTNIKIPKQIIKNINFQKRCVVGIIDTDFNIDYLSRINGSLTNLYVIKQMCKILKENKINYKNYFKGNSGRIIINKENSIKIYKEWKLKNQKHITKFKLKKEFNKFLPFTTTIERLAVLNEKLDIKNLEKLSNKRRKIWKSKRK